MANTVLVGLQWGDEGKGKIIDVLTETSEVVVRFQGGNNAGHTVEIGDRKYILHLVPSGILRPDALCVIGNGVVVNPLCLVEEMNELAEGGIEVGHRLRLSDRCQLILPYHCTMDGIEEGRLGANKIGTTKRGIGPAYQDKVKRSGIRAALLKQPAELKERFLKVGRQYNAIFREAGVRELDLEAEWKQLEAAAGTLAPLVEDTALLLNQQVIAGKSVLFEGAQGTWLDVDFGTYPYVTSSNTIAGAACTGAGLAPQRIDRVIGVAKAYTTRVGGGPFPTEFDPEMGENVRRRGAEFGATTGRPRRCGWFDAVATKYAVMLSGADRVAVTKLDVLDTLETLNVCTAYDLDGRTITEMPADSAELSRVVPRYEELPGWCADTTEVTCYEDLPAKAKAYIERLMELVGARAEIVSVGPRRDQTFPANG